MPMDLRRYPKYWKALASAIKEHAAWKCSSCGKQCRRPGEKFVTHRKTLTVAHLDHDPENPTARLAALCAPCHLRYDNKARKKV